MRQIKKYITVCVVCLWLHQQTTEKIRTGVYGLLIFYFVQELRESLLFLDTLQRWQQLAGTGAEQSFN